MHVGQWKFFVNNILEAIVFVSLAHAIFQSTQSQSYHVQGETELFLISNEIVDTVIQVLKARSRECLAL